MKVLLKPPHIVSLLVLVRVRCYKDISKVCRKVYTYVSTDPGLAQAIEHAMPLRLG